MKYLKLSRVKTLDYDSLINFLLENKYNGVINDITPKPNIEYDICDLEIVWENLKRYINFNDLIHF